MARTLTQSNQSPVRDRAAWIELGHLLKSHGYLDDAIEAYREAIREEVGNAESWRFLGNAFYTQRDFNKALDAYRESAIRNPGEIKIWLNLGNTYKQLGYKVESIASFDRALQLGSTEAQSLPRTR